jgi:hypothetical protein
MPDLNIRLVQKDEHGQDQTVAEGTHDQMTIQHKG